MPVQTSPPSFPDSFPSFMSVYGGFPARYKEDEHSIHPLQVPAHVPVNTNSRRLFPSVHRESVSSMTSGSTESSPTTTISPFDSPSTGDISPSSSPETPSAMPLSYPKFTPIIRPVEVAPLSTMTSDSSRLSLAPNPPRPDSPGRRARNLKNLSLRMPLPSQSRPPIATASMLETSSKHYLSAPPSPIPIPPKSSRRRPANLTIRTPGFDKSFTTNVPDLVPPTPMGRQSLRHAESSPSLASITSPGFAPRGGMQLPRPTSHHGARRLSGTSSEDTSPLTSMPDDGSAFSQRVIPEEEEDEPMHSRESTRGTDRGYPNGPIRIYDTGVFLYLEPTAEEAAQFDVVINVAKEVKNPFNTDNDARNNTVMSTWRNASMASKRFSGGDPQTAISEISFKSAFEYQPSESGSATPTTPTPKSTTPEYIHVGWDHNSEILDDLLPLCELVDDRIAQGKKVLIHCQLGASRSASLVIAYGLYKNRNLDFNSMYDLVKARSQWVGPNMSLIYQLTDYRSRLLRGSPSSRPAPREWFVQTGRRSSEPQVTRAERVEAQQRTAVPMMGLLPTPPTHSLRPKTSSNHGNRSPKRSLSPRPLPFRQKFQSVEPASGRPRGLPRSVSSCDPLVQTHVFVRDGPGSPDLGAGFFSPRTTGFLAPPIPLPSLPSRGLDSTMAESSSSVQYAEDTADPRSPPPGGERMILRNIDEFL
ncbi:Tyrosine-protein phosphatase pmp1 [Penicillium subrubescens]|uniref:protein-tyrosine-phosphatase n=2 Tax=Penicillium subrubescens TaxID=1316194 RepID=A0A1Q5UQI7_9EURO|nr:Tyrosine-protein phosphatase pmp1 [Penicillium subrubescens]